MTNQSILKPGTKVQYATDDKRRCLKCREVIAPGEGYVDFPLPPVGFFSYHAKCCKHQENLVYKE